MSLKILVGRKKEKERANCLCILQQGIQANLFIPESWIEVAT